jgi:PhoPQ-activated pathogenicity-related protein
MVSQTWQGQFWSHHIQVIKPATIRHPDIALLFVTGDGEGTKDLERLNVVAQRAGAIVAVITKVPNQPLYDGKKEDSLIAYTFGQFMKTGDATWPLLFPMVKSAVRGMDTIQAFARQEFKQEVTKFVISGASKRGWTTWLTGAADKRVVAIAPIVIDMLNMKEQLAWTAKMYGKQSEQIQDYTEMNFDKLQDDPRMVTLRGWVDPYSYRNRYTMPKLILIGTNDPYWVVDSLRHYWGDLPEQKLVYQTPNAGHDLAGGKDAILTMAAWFQMIADGEKLPKLDWKLSDGTVVNDGSPTPAGISVKLDRPARKFRVWTAESEDRDFRNDKWTSREIESKNGGLEASVQIEKPATGFRATMIEAEVESAHGEVYKLSTQVQVVPDNIGVK